jgi:hypothetical protein
LLADILRDACERGLPPDLVHVMRAKVAQRVYKIRHIIDEHQDSAVVVFVNEAIKLAKAYLDENIRKVHAQQSTPCKWIPPTEEEFVASQNLSLTNSRPRLERAHRRRTELEQKGDDKFDIEAFNIGLPITYRPSSAVGPPCIIDNGTDQDRISSILEVERWVADDLPVWTTSDEFDFEKLADVILDHIRVALGRYGHSPERISRMLLTVFELWVALDKKVIDETPLLAQYSPEVPLTLFEALILPTREELQRVHSLEEYLSGRYSRVTRGWPSAIYCEEANVHSFAVKYFDSSSDLCALQHDIVDKATRSKAEKVKEFQRDHARHQQLVQEAGGLDCSYQSRTNRWGSTYQEHQRWACRRCSLTDQAQSMKIEIFEWPLPQLAIEAKLAIFELRPPAAFSAWRFVTDRLLRTLAVKEESYANEEEPKANLPSYWPLSTYMERPAVGSSMSLASQPKSFYDSHYRHVTVAGATKDDVLKNHPLRLRPYDLSLKRWISRPSADIRTLCEFKLPRGPYHTLQWTVPSTAHLPNDVIARQSNCPAEISLHEWDAFGHLRSGCALQWRNLVLQLHTTDLTFSDPAVHLLVMQLVWQAESRGQAVLRQAHAELALPSFITRAVVAMRTRLSAITENWQEGVFLLSHPRPCRD